MIGIAKIKKFFENLGQLPYKADKGKLKILSHECGFHIKTIIFKYAFVKL